MAEILPEPGARAPPPLPDHLVEEILIRLASPADLVRASAACASFRRLIAADSFLRRYRSLHPPLLLGILTAEGFLPAESRHPNALTAQAFVRAADFSECQGTGWVPFDARNGRVLLRSYKMCEGGHILPELAVYDPLTQGRTLLPTIPESLVAAVLGSPPLQYKHIRNFIAFFIPTADFEEAQFRVVAWTYTEALAVAFVYSSLSGTWSDGISIASDPPGFDVQQFTSLDLWPSYAYGCFYWKLQSCNKLLKLDVNRFEFSFVVHPHYHENQRVVVVEAGEGRIGIITRAGPKIPELRYSIWQNDTGNDDEHTTETTILLPSDYHCCLFVGATEGYIILFCLENVYCPTSVVFLSLNIKTLEIVRVCSAPMQSSIFSYTPFLYFRYPPFLSPRRI